MTMNEDHIERIFDKLPEKEKVTMYKYPKDGLSLWKEENNKILKSSKNRSTRNRYSSSPSLTKSTSRKINFSPKVLHLVSITEHS